MQKQIYQTAAWHVQLMQISGIKNVIIVMDEHLKLIVKHFNIIKNPHSLQRQWKFLGKYYTTKDR